MSETIANIIYMVSAIFFIRGIKLMGRADTARKGNLLSSVGMLVAVVTILAEKQVVETGVVGYSTVAVAVVLGTLIGAVWARRVKMTEMPQLVALLNGFGGLSSMLVALAQFLIANPYEENLWFIALSCGLTIAIGAVAFTGSVIAWGKLAGNFIKDWNRVPAKNAVNTAVTIVGLAGVALYTAYPTGTWSVVGVATASVAFLVLGFTLVIQ